MNIKIEDHIDYAKIMKKIQNDQLGMTAATEWYRLVDPYVPYRTGQLAETDIEIRPWEIEYYAPYAHRLYNGTKMNFRKDHHPKAGAQWDKRAAQEGQKMKLIAAVQKWANQNI